MRKSSGDSFTTSSPQRAHHVVSNSKLQFKNPWQTFEESQEVDSGSINQQAQAQRADSGMWTSGLNWMSRISSMVSNIPIEWARELTGHAQRPVKVVQPYFVDGGAGLSSSDESTSGRSIKATWLGHASFLVEMPSGQHLLFDPIFSDRAGPSAWTGIRRRLPPPCTIEELPAVHVVLISHNHYDHLDLPSIQTILNIRGKEVLFVVPLGLASWLIASGIPAEQIQELDWWDEKSISYPSQSPDPDDTILITCTPAQHTSGRNFMDRNTTLWCSWAVRQTLKGKDGKSESANIYHAGDTGYMTPRGPCPVFKEIGERLGPFDLAMIPIWRGGTLGFISQLGLRLTHNRALSALHCTPVEAVRGIHPDVRARHSLACHFATFAGSDAEALEPLVELEWAKRKGATWDGKRELVVRELDVETARTAGGSAEGEAGAGADEGAKLTQRLFEEKEDIGDWMEEGGFGWIDVGSTAEIPLHSNKD